MAHILQYIIFFIQRVTRYKTISVSSIVLTLSTPSATIVVFNQIYLPTKSLLLGMKWQPKHLDLEMFGPKLNKYEYFSPPWSGGSR